VWHSYPGAEIHFVLETAAYVVGSGVYWYCARKTPQPPLGDSLLLIGGAALGALLGSKALHVLEHLPSLAVSSDFHLWLAGKSILGGLMGGTLGVEIVKRYVGWRQPTGDPWVPALVAGLLVGRLGCQLSGTWDLTYGIPTAVPWAWNYGDGVGRHPTAIYEMILVALVFGLTLLMPLPKGGRFAMFMIGYCAIRLGLEWLKPPFGESAPDTLPVALYAHLTAIQWAALLGLAWYFLLLRIRFRDDTEFRHG